jgi:ACS family tartrate transporter-like MFS transporter
MNCEPSTTTNPLFHFNEESKNLATLLDKPNPTLEHTVLRKVAFRLIPFMFIMYIFNYLDRQNVAYAALHMQKALHFSDAVYGTGAGIFFIGYFLFEVPSNLIMEKTGARIWIARIMITWGIISSCMLFTNSKGTFYALRFLLGLAEAGFFPGMILYLTYWFPAKERARAISCFMTATPLSGVIGGPLSVWLLENMNGKGSLQGWQWMFLVEGIPSFILGFVVLFYLTDTPAKAKWLKEDEKVWLTQRLQSEEHHRRSRHHMTLFQALKNPKVLLLCALYFTLQIGFYGFNFWLPKLLLSFGVPLHLVGKVAVVPYICAAVAMVLIGIRSDRSGVRDRFVAAGAAAAAIGMFVAGMIVSQQLKSPIPGIAALVLAAIGLWSTLGPFWSLPTSFLTGSAAAGGIAMINSVGNLGGYVGPTVMGYTKEWTKNDAAGLFVLSTSLIIACVLALNVRHDSSLEHAPPAPES